MNDMNKLYVMNKISDFEQSEHYEHNEQDERKINK